jgi:hypothetical protein
MAFQESGDDLVLELNFAGIEPATWGVYKKLPKGEYNVQVVSCEKFYAKDKTTKEPDPNKPGLHFVFSVTNHPEYEGTELHYYQMLGKENYKFLLNTLMCLIPEMNWQQDGIKVPLSQLIAKVQGRPSNAFVDWEINAKDNKRYVNNVLQGLKPYDPSIKQPVAKEGDPPIIVNDAGSPVAQQAVGGVSREEAEAFLSSLPGQETPAAAPSSAPATSNFFGDEPF